MSDNDVQRLPFGADDLRLPDALRGPLRKHLAALKANYLKRGWGMRVGWGERPALIVIDMARYWLDPELQIGSNLDSVMEGTCQVLAAARRVYCSDRTICAASFSDQKHEELAERGQPARDAARAKTPGREIGEIFADIRGFRLGKPTRQKQGQILKVAPIGFDRIVGSTTLSSHHFEKRLDLAVIAGGDCGHHSPFATAASSASDRASRTSPTRRSPSITARIVATSAPPF